jgi:hypothetical protein
MAGVKKNKELNLLTALDRGKQRQKAGKGAIVVIALIALVVAAVAYFFVYTLGETDRLTEQRDTALAYVNDPETKAKYDESLANQQEAKMAQIRSDTLKSALDAINSYPTMYGPDYKALFLLAGNNVELSGITYDRSTGRLSFGATCQSATRIPIFIATLRSCGMFSDVDYSGYTGGTRTVPGEPQVAEDGTEVETQVTETEYSFSVNCVVNSDEQREAVRSGIKAEDADEEAADETAADADESAADTAEQSE